MWESDLPNEAIQLRGDDATGRQESADGLRPDRNPVARKRPLEPPSVGAAGEVALEAMESRPAAKFGFLLPGGNSELGDVKGKIYEGQRGQIRWGRRAELIEITDGRNSRQKWGRFQKSGGKEILVQECSHGAKHHGPAGKTTPSSTRWEAQCDRRHRHVLPLHGEASYTQIRDRLWRIPSRAHWC